MDEEMKKEPRRRKKVRPEPEAEAQDSCAKANIKNVWVVGIAVIVLVTIFCLALFNKPSRPVNQPLPQMPVNAQGVAMEGFAVPMPQYQMDPLLQQIAPQPVAMAYPYAANCPIPGSGYGQMNMQPMMMPVAAAGAHTAPPIFRDALMPHQYRGVCENCHIVSPDIPIPANATMKHEYRGVCSNCHTILGMTNNAGA